MTITQCIFGNIDCIHNNSGHSNLTHPLEPLKPVDNKSTLLLYNYTCYIFKLLDTTKNIAGVWDTICLIPISNMLFLSQAVHSPKISKSVWHMKIPSLRWNCSVVFGFIVHYLYFTIPLCFSSTSITTCTFFSTLLTSYFLPSVVESKTCTDDFHGYLPKACTFNIFAP